MSDLTTHKGRVIITYGRSLMALTAAHSLGSRGIEVIGCDDVGMTVLHFSRHVTDNFIHAPYQHDEEQYLNDMEEHIKAHKPDDDRPYILMPMFRDAKLLAKHRDRFSGLIDIAAPDYKIISQVHPKDVFADTCEAYNLCIPETHQPDNMAALKEMKDTLSFPVLIKPTDEVGGHGIHKAHDFNALCKLFEGSIDKYGGAPLIQDVIEGEDYCLSTLCDHGKVIAHMAYKNLYQYPRGSGAGIMRETIDDAPFMDTAQTLLQSLNWHGIAQIDFRWTGKPQDPAYLIEVNPRFWAGLFHSVESGIDFPWLLYQLTAFGKIDHEDTAKIGVKTKIPGLWALSALQEIAESETHFEDLEKAWADIWNKNNDAGWREKLSTFGKALKESVDGKDIIDQIKAMYETSKNAKSEFVSDDDPFTGLGLLFIGSSLLRHGELPPEIRS